MGGDDAFVSIKNSLNTFTSYQWGTKSSEVVGGCAFDTTTGVFCISSQYGASAVVCELFNSMTRNRCCGINTSSFAGIQ